MVSPGQGEREFVDNRIVNYIGSEIGAKMRDTYVVDWGANNNSSSCCLRPRKRKEHDSDLPPAREDLCGQECKLSRTSQPDVVDKYMRSWMTNLANEVSPETKTQTSPLPSPELAPKSDTWDGLISDSRKENEDPDLEVGRGEARWSVPGELEPERSGQFISPARHLEGNFNVCEIQKKSTPRKSKSRQISKKLLSLETRIEEAGAQVEAQKGHRLSAADKLKDETLGYLKLEQVNLKLKQDVKSSKGNKDSWDRSSRAKHYPPASSSRFIVKKSAEEDKNKMIKDLNELRKTKERPEELDLMTLEQMLDEKLDMQTQLIEYEKVHGLHSKQANREIMADLYERYRLVLRQTRRLSSARWSVTSLPGGLGSLDSIPEDGPVSDQGGERRRSLETEGHRSHSPSWSSLPLVQLFMGHEAVEEDALPDPSSGLETQDFTKYHTMTQSELFTTLKELREEKKMLKIKLQKISDQFRRENGRNLSKDDRELLDDYKMYKGLKPKIKLVDALLCKYSTVFLDH